MILVATYTWFKCAQNLKNDLFASRTEYVPERHQPPEVGPDKMVIGIGLLPTFMYLF